MSATDPRKNPKLHVPFAPEGFELRGVSTLVDAEGKPVSSWVKTARAPGKPEDLAKVYKDAMKLVTSAYRAPSRASGVSAEDLLCVYPLGDPHVGMLAWPAESGKAWDLKIAAGTHAQVVGQLIEHAPATRHGILANLGDLIHADGSRSKTFAGTEVDTDGRYPKILRAATSMMIGLTEKLLGKHDIVHVVNVRGNHDTDVSVAVAEIMRAHFRNEPRVLIKSNAALHTYMRWEQNLFGYHHGHATKPNNLPLVMATDRPVAWGATRHRKWFVGHVHHASVKEHPGCLVETYNTLASSDAWHRGAGYRSAQRATCEVYHKETGRVAKYEITL